MANILNIFLVMGTISSLGAVGSPVVRGGSASDFEVRFEHPIETILAGGGDAVRVGRGLLETWGLLELQSGDSIAVEDASAGAGEWSITTLSCREALIEGDSFAGDCVRTIQAELGGLSQDYEIVLAVLEAKIRYELGQMDAWWGGELDEEEHDLADWVQVRDLFKAWKNSYDADPEAPETLIAKLAGNTAYCGLILALPETGLSKGQRASLCRALARHLPA